MVAWEPWDKQELWLARAVPRKWFERGFSVSCIPTRWCAVSFTVIQSGKGLAAQVELASVHPELKVYFRLRPKWARSALKVIVEGTKNWKWDSNKEVVELWGAWKRVTIHMASRERTSSAPQDREAPPISQS
jgi:hypothetical protein